MKKLFLAFVAFVAMNVMATPNIQNVTAKQRFPWNGLVDITCTVTGIEKSAPYKFYIEAVQPDEAITNKVAQFWVIQNGTKQSNFKVTANDEYHLIWDAKTDLGVIRCPNMIVCVGLEDGRDKVQLWEGGPYWATTNIGAEKPEDSGYFFWWGDTVGYKRENNKWVASDGSNSNFSFSSGNVPTYGKSMSTLKSEGWITADNILTPKYDAANAHWGYGWRIPTIAELQKLISNCNWTWGSKNGVKGYIIKGNGAYSYNSIFLPAVGRGNNTSLEPTYDETGFASGVKSEAGHYWSSVANRTIYNYHPGDFAAEYLFFAAKSYHKKEAPPDFGQSIRPIQNFATIDIETAESNSFVLDTQDEPLLKNTVSYNSSWIGDDSSATVVITDNGTEIYRGSGEGEFEWEPTTVGKHTLTYTTYINDVVQSEVYEATVYSGFKYEVVGDGVVITEAASPSSELVIPNEIDGKAVSGIANGLLSGNGVIENVVISDGVSEIGEGTFANCESLSNVVIPPSVTSMVNRSKRLIDFDGAVAAYEFNGTLDDGTGYVPNGTGSYADNRFGVPNSAYYFNGQGQRFSASNRVLEQNFSFGFWFKTEARIDSVGNSTSTLKERGNYILHPPHGGSNRGYGIKVGIDGMKVVAHGDGYFASSVTYEANIGSDWNHVVVVVDGNTSIKLYLNGVEVANGTGPSATAMFRVDAGGSYGCYTGYLDDLVVFDSAIDATTVSNLYKWTVPVASFTGCTSLKDVTMPGALCSSMAEVFPDSYMSITNVTLTGNIAQIPAGAFAACAALESVTLAQSGATIALGGEKGWSFDEEGAMRSGKIAHNESSTMNMTVQGEGRLTYRWKASSEYYSEYISDYAYLSIDDDAKGSCEDWTLEGYAIGGETDWQECVIDVVGDKPHEINWTFKKDFEDSGNVGDDCIWVDLIKYEPFIKVSFDIAGAEGTIPELIKEVCGGSINLPSAGGFAKAKHTFVGWSDGVQTHAPGAAYQVGAEDVVLTAVYEANTLAAPVISSTDVASGGSIETESATIEIAAGDGAAIYYTLDGTMPTSESLLYSGAFEADGLGLVTVKAIAVRDNCFDSEVSEFTFTRRPYSAAECLNANGLVFTLGGDAEWFRVFDGASHDGDAALRSGVILDGQSTYVETKVNGPGTISFWWKTSCEIEFKGKKLDHVSFIDRFNEVDTEKTYLTGDSGEWVQVTIDITGSGEHTLKWVYQKNNSGFDGEDCAWLDEVVWTPAPVETQTTVVSVPFAWLQEKYPSITDAAAFEAKANEVAANGVNKVWECYVAGIDPTDATAKFVTKIEMVDGKPVITWEPDMNKGAGKIGARTYKILGSTDLKTWTEVADEAEANFNFFKVEVSMP